jgi:hypothetical protein
VEQIAVHYLDFNGLKGTCRTRTLPAGVPGTFVAFWTHLHAW